MPGLTLIVIVLSSTVICTASDLVESAVEVALIVGVAAPLSAGVKVTGVPELTPEEALSVPAPAGLIERFTVFVNAPVPVTVGVQTVVWMSVMDPGVHANETLPTVGGTGLIVMAAEPWILVYPETVDVATTLAVVIAVIDEEHVSTPCGVIVPALAGLTDQVTT